MGPSGGLMLDGDLLAQCSMAICPFTGLFLVATRSGCLEMVGSGVGMAAVTWAQTQAPTGFGEVLRRYGAAAGLSQES